jgi:hypothetical protein
VIQGNRAGIWILAERGKSRSHRRLVQVAGRVEESARRTGVTKAGRCEEGKGEIDDRCGPGRRPGDKMGEGRGG